MPRAHAFPSPVPGAAPALLRLIDAASMRIWDEGQWHPMRVGPMA